MSDNSTIFAKLSDTYGIEVDMIKMMYAEDNDKLERIRRLLTFLIKLHREETKDQTKRVGRPKKYLDAETAKRVKRSQSDASRARKLAQASSVVV